MHVKRGVEMRNRRRLAAQQANSRGADDRSFEPVADQSFERRSKMIAEKNRATMRRQNRRRSNDQQLPHCAEIKNRSHGLLSFEDVEMRRRSSIRSENLLA